MCLDRCGRRTALAATARACRVPCNAQACHERGPLAGMAWKSRTYTPQTTSGTGSIVERVAQLLDSESENFSYRHALVRLWMLASNDQRLNGWEQGANETTIPPHYDAFLNQLQDAEPIQRQAILAQPLALIRALDDYLASTTPLDSQSASTSRDAYVINEEGKGYWLVPVPLAARRQAAMNRQPARLARWFHHHAALPARTAHGIEVTAALSRSALNTALEDLSNQSQGQLKAWIAHFDDGADVVWDQQISPIANWRTLSVEPHATRQDTMLQTLAVSARAGAQVVVFPEFTLDLQHRDQLVTYLRQNPSGIQLVVAGAFHEPEAATDPSVAYNTAPVFTGSGRKLFVHRKLRLFGKSDVGAECAQVGNSLHVLITPIGCMTILICKDFLDEHPRVDNLLAEVPVDWVWVPSYGDETTLKGHKERARKLATVTTGTSCAVAQTQNTAMKKSGETQALLPGFGHPAGKNVPCDVPASGGLVVFGLERQAAPVKTARSRLKRVK